MGKIGVSIILLAASSLAMAQVGTTLKEGGKATVEKGAEIGDRAKAAVESQPHKSMDEAKAHVHRAKAHHHAKAAKAAAKEIPK